MVNYFLLDFVKVYNINKQGNVCCSLFLLLKKILLNYSNFILSLMKNKKIFLVCYFKFFYYK